jgi:hypothetical protein
MAPNRSLRAEIARFQGLNLSTKQERALQQFEAECVAFGQRAKTLQRQHAADQYRDHVLDVANVTLLAMTTQNAARATEDPKVSAARLAFLGQRLADLKPQALATIDRLEAINALGPLELADAQLERFPLGNAAPKAPDELLEAVAAAERQAQDSAMMQQLRTQHAAGRLR